MARIPSFQFEQTTFDAPLVRVNREKIYGWTNKKYLDNNGNQCQFVNLLDDGKTLVGNGCLALKSYDSDANEVNRKEFIALNENDEPVEKQPSIFEKINVLTTEKGLEDYLSMNVKSLYQINTSDLAEKDALLASLKEHSVLYFKFNYMPGYDPDDAFVLASAENIFVVVGKINDFVYAQLDAVVELEEEADEADDDLDFSMF